MTFSSWAVSDCNQSYPSDTHEDLEDTTGLLVDQARDTLDTTTASETTDGGLGNAPDWVSSVRHACCRWTDWMLSRNTFLWRLAPPLPRPLPPFPRPDIVLLLGWLGVWWGS